MRTEISKTEFEAAFSQDLREMFETMVQMHSYLEVVAVDAETSPHKLVGALSTVETTTGGYFNASCWFAQENGRYAFEAGIEKGEITQRFFAYDTTADAIAHLNELLMTVNSDI